MSIRKEDIRMHRARGVGGALLAGVLAVAAIGCGGTSDAAGGKDKLTLVAYSTPQEAYQEIIPAFQKTPAGKGVKFTQSYGASGEQERAVEAGLQADVVALSLAPDVDKLVKADLVNSDWTGQANGGFVTNSVVVFEVRKGNPKHIKTWDDLVKPGVDVISPNPFTSGGAKWNIMAAYGARGLPYLSKLFENVSVLDKSAREAQSTFTSGKGDVLIAYENEAITAQQKGEKVEYVIPDQTILIQNPAAVTSDSKNAVTAEAFVDYLHSDTAQKIYAEHGYRSIKPSLVDKSKFPTPSGLFEITKFGGWSKVNDEVFDPSNGKVAK
ncbi:MAG TPA: sulfate ABC transporter substrate-binding protein, partial [Thermoleophilaceae bacterium]